MSTMYSRSVAMLRQAKMQFSLYRRMMRFWVLLALKHSRQLSF